MINMKLKFWKELSYQNVKLKILRFTKLKGDSFKVKMQ